MHIVSHVLRLRHVLKMVNHVAKRAEHGSEARVAAGLARLRKGVQQCLTSVPVRVLLGYWSEDIALRVALNASYRSQCPVRRSDLVAENTFMHPAAANRIVKMPRKARHNIFLATANLQQFADGPALSRNSR